MSRGELRLDRPLPPEIAPKLPAGIGSYQQFPVFTWPWLRGRTSIFALAVGSYGAMSALGLYAQDGRGLHALSVGLLFSCGGVLMSTAGPLVATFVRARKLTFERERAWIVFGTAFGMVLSAAVDVLVSGALESTIGDTTAHEHVPNGWVVAFNLAVLVTIYVLLGGGLALRRYFHETTAWSAVLRERETQRLREDNQKLDATLSLLQAQIEPHFLFNTLASVRSLVKADPARAEAIVDRLVDYLRATIPRLRGHEAASDLGGQVDLCESYLLLMKARTERLDYRIDIPGELRGVPVLPLLIMTLVENAVKHGIEPKRGPGRVSLRARRADDALVIEVIDDGVGLSEGLSGGGMGLQNVRERLRLRYGSQASLSLAGNSGSGATATVRLPFPDAEPRPE